jgi:hypothetical protein
MGKEEVKVTMQEEQITAFAFPSDSFPWLQLS